MTKVSNVLKGTAAPAAAAPKPDANGIIYVTDKKGRKIGLKKLTPSQRFMIDDAVEAKTMSAGLQIKMVASVISIDEDGMTPIASRADVLARLDLLGDEGLEVITEPCLKMYGIDFGELEKAAAKNL